MIEWLWSALSITGAVLNARKNKWGFAVWCVSNTGWIFTNIFYELWAQIPVWVVFTVTSIYGFIHWSREENETQSTV